MKIIFYYAFYFIISLLIVNNEPLSLNEILIPEGVYNIILKKKYYSLSYNNGIKLSKDKLGSNEINFRIMVSEFDQKTNTTYFTIRHLKSNIYLGINSTRENKVSPDSLITNSEIIQNERFSFNFKFIKIEENVYAIQSKKGCYLTEKNDVLLCEYRNPTQYSHFHLLKLFSEVKKNIKNDELILEKEPIDVLIKYIDLSDPNLHREGLHHIKKDNENEELRYSIRSILTNIPWVRKIFILMPNEKVRFFKDYDLIKEKIVYVKDKDFLGYDSSNSHAFQYRLWKMKEYGISDNFIIMDDDYFIGKPLNKSDFFYVENNTVFPAIISTNYEVHTQKTFLRDYNNLKKKLKDSREQSSNTFVYTMYNTYFFFIDYFKGPIIVPYFTHNAIPSNINDLKEIYDLVYNSEYRNATLESLNRHIESLQFQTSVNIYTFNKYSRKVNLVEYNYIDNENTLNGDYNYPLFCINTGNNNDYTQMSFPKTKLVMEKLFPYPTPYEIIDYNIIPKLAYNLVKYFEDEIKNVKNNDDKEIIIKLKSESEKKKLYIDKCDIIIEKYKNSNNIILNKTLILKKELDYCLKILENIENDVIFLEKYKAINNFSSIDYLESKNELEKKIVEEKNNLMTLNIYENGINENKKKIEEYLKKQKKLNFIAYLELCILIILLIIYIFYSFCHHKIM